MTGPGDADRQRMESVLHLYPALLVFFRYHWRDHGALASEDLAHETILAAWEALQRLGSDIQDLRAYVLGIARKKLLDAQRDVRRRREEALDPELHDGMIKRLAEFAMEHRLFESERREILRSELKRLSNEDRRLLELWCQHEIRHDDLSRCLDLAPEECSRRKYRALKALRDRVEKRLRRKKR